MKPFLALLVSLCLCQCASLAPGVGKVHIAPILDPNTNKPVLLTPKGVKGEAKPSKIMAINEDIVAELQADNQAGRTPTHHLVTDPNQQNVIVGIITSLTPCTRLNGTPVGVILPSVTIRLVGIPDSVIPPVMPKVQQYAYQKLGKHYDVIQLSELKKLR
jgi:hypothetical protein